MYTGLLHLHSLLRWIILILLIWAIIKSMLSINAPFTSAHKHLGLFLTISADIMLLLGLYQYFTGGLGFQLFKQVSMAEIMSNDKYRFFAVEHIAGMIVAIILLHLGKSYGKKAIPDKAKHKRTILFYLLALIIILVSIPWPFRSFIGEGRGWLPGM